jgi:hypothetical protein
MLFLLIKYAQQHIKYNIIMKVAAIELKSKSDLSLIDG